MSIMRIAPTGREYAHWTILGAGDASLEASFDGETWHVLTLVEGEYRVLVAGPDATSNPDGTVILPLARSIVSIRATDNPEVVIRGGGVIDVA